MRFVYHHRTQGRGGEGVHIAGLVHALDAQGHSVVVVSPPGVDPLHTAGAAPTDKSDASVRGMSRVWRWVSRHLPQWLFELLEIGYNAYAWWGLRRALVAEPDVVLYERYAFFSAVGTAVARGRGIPTLLEVNEVAGIPRARGLTLRRIAAALERRIFRSADAVLCVSSFLAAEAVQRGAHPDRVQVIPNAVDRNLFTDQSGRDLRSELGFRGRVVVGFVGWFDEWDRLEVLLEAVADIAPNHPELRVLLVGDGPRAGFLQETSHRLGLGEVVHFTGTVARREVPAYLEAIDIAVLPSSNTFGSPIVLFEFMAMGKAVIAPDLDPIRDVVQDGETAVLVPPAHRGALGDALSALIADEGRRWGLGRRARERVLSTHTWDATASKVVDIARSLTGEARR